MRRTSDQRESSDAISVPKRKALARQTERESRPLNIGKIVVPVDFSKQGQAAIVYAASLAKRFKASLILTHVIERIYHADEFAYVQINTPRMRQRVTKDLRRLKASLPVALKAEVEVREGSAFEGIVAVAKETHADLIIMATRGYTGLKHAFLGSTAERVVQHASCPVLVVPPRMDEESVLGHE